MTPEHGSTVDGVLRRSARRTPARVAVEYDGEDFHSRPEQRERDRQRRAKLRELGWKVMVLTKGDFSPERTDEWIRRLRDALAGL